MAWKDVKVGYKISFGFSIVIIALLVFSILSYTTIVRIDKAEDELSHSLEILFAVEDAKLAHLNFIMAIQNHVMSKETTNLNLERDFKACDFGKWFYAELEEAKRNKNSESSKIYLTDIPNVNISLLEESHENIHGYVDLIQDTILSDDFDLASDLYAVEILPEYEKLISELNAIANFYDKSVKSSYAIIDYEENVALNTILYGSILTLIISLVTAFLQTINITQPISKLVEYATTVSTGNLNVKSPLTQKDEVGKLADTVELMVQNLKEQLIESERKTKQATESEKEAERVKLEVESAAKKMEATHAEMRIITQGLEEIIVSIAPAFSALESSIKTSEYASQESADKVYQTVTAMGEMSAAASEIASNSSATTDIAKQSKSVAERGLTLVANVMKSINELHSKSQTLKADMTQLSEHANSVGNIMVVISDIADQTNLLALNAAIEAARAGEAGRGFAVVADEVRKLAEKTMTSTVDVNKVITAIQDSIEKNISQVNATVATVEVATDLSIRSQEGLKEIVSMADNSEAQVISIASASEEQAQTFEEINAALEALTINAESATSAVESVKNASQILAEQSNELGKLIEKLKNC